MIVVTIEFEMSHTESVQWNKNASAPMAAPEPHVTQFVEDIPKNPKSNEFDPEELYTMSGGIILDVIHADFWEWNMPDCESLRPEKQFC